MFCAFVRRVLSHLVPEVAKKHQEIDLLPQTQFKVLTQILSLKLKGF